MHDFEGILSPRVAAFVEEHVADLLTWDILAYFQHNRDSVLDYEALAGRLGRHREELTTRVDSLCEQGILVSTEGNVSLNPDNGLQDELDEFVSACEESSTRLALIALVLHKMSRTFETQQ